ncbi:hypothetical protein [Amycolatopsis sp. NPDC004079]|uniref:hypothetical protein n=1 Tax=Amycolatopsis sp. NPDC004079 TaxID=3154549 RepID=UPI0033AC86D1
MPVVHERPTASRRPAADLVARLCQAAAEHRAHGEERSCLHPRVQAMLAASPLPRAALPAGCGGLEWTAPQIMDAVRAVAAADPSAGWVAAIHAPAGAFLSRAEPALARVLAGAAPVIGGSSVPAGTASPQHDGVRVRGRWPLVSGAPGMTLAALAAPLDGAGGNALRWWLVPRGKLAVEDDWDAFGLRGSASCSVVCDAVVPADHSIRLSDPPLVDAPLFRYPLYGLLAGCIAVVAQGVAERALAAFARLARTAGTRHDPRPLAAQPAAQEAFAAADGRVRAAAGALAAAAADAWSSAAEGEVPVVLRARLRLACCDMAEAAEHACRRLFDAAGSAALHRCHELEGCWRDAVAVSRHALVAGHGRRIAGNAVLASIASADL